MTGKVSIISANFNKAKFIAEMIDSILAQTYTNWELIIVDDKSTDSSVEEVSKYSDERISLVVNDINKGANYSRNYGLSASKGEYILFLDSDDILIPTCLENRVKSIEGKELDMCVFPMGVFKTEVGDSPKSMYWTPKDHDLLNRFLSHDLPWAICQPIWKASFLKGLGGFDESFVRLQDVELHTRAIINNCKLSVVADEVSDCYYRIDEKRFEKDYFPFLKRHVQGGIQYFNKFVNQVDSTGLKYLHLTLLNTGSSVIHYRVEKKISKVEYVEIYMQLLNSCSLIKSRSMLRFYFAIFRILPLRIRGVRKIVEKIMLF